MQTPLCPGPPGRVPCSMFFLLSGPSPSTFPEPFRQAEVPCGQHPRAPQPSVQHTHLLPPAPAPDGGCILLREGVLPPQKGLPRLSQQNQELLPRNLLASQAYFVYHHVIIVFVSH